jgi:hypothetical protein
MARKTYAWASILEDAGHGRVPASNEIDAAQAALAIRFPDSYIDYVSVLGAGTIDGFFEVYLPYEVVEKSEQVRAAISTYLEGLNDGAADQPSDDYRDDVTEALFRRLVAFCETDHGEFLAWDPLSYKDGECRIYLIGYHFEIVKYSSPDLFSFFLGIKRNESCAVYLEKGRSFGLKFIPRPTSRSAG